MLAQAVLGTLGIAVLASLVKAMAVESLFARRLDRSTRYSLRSRDRELNRRRIYRTTRNDALLGIGAFVRGYLDL